jgi:DNA-binding MarR family transcriptional regulator
LSEAPEQAVDRFVASRPDTGRSMAVWYQIFRLYRTLVTELEAEYLRAAGLTYRGYFNLVLLWIRGPQGVGDMSQSQGLSRPAIVQSVNTLEKRGLVRRDRRTDDRRQVDVVITDAGRALVERLHVQVAAYDERSCSALTAAELETLLHLLRKMGARSGPPADAQ